MLRKANRCPLGGPRAVDCKFINVIDKTIIHISLLYGNRDSFVLRFHTFFCRFFQSRVYWIFFLHDVLCRIYVAKLVCIFVKIKTVWYKVKKNISNVHTRCATASSFAISQCGYALFYIYGRATGNTRYPKQTNQNRVGQWCKKYCVALCTFTVPLSSIMCMTWAVSVSTLQLSTRSRRITLRMSTLVLLLLRMRSSSRPACSTSWEPSNGTHSNTSLCVSCLVSMCLRN